MKRIFLLLISVMLVLGSVCVTGVSAEGLYSEIDLSVTGVTVIKAGETTKIAVNGKTDVSDVTYQSSNPEFATVSDSGVVTGVKTGATTITATSGDASDSVMILVSDVTPKAATFSATLYTKGYVEDDSELKRTENSSIKLLKSSNLVGDVLNGTYNTVSYWVYDNGTSQTSAVLKPVANKNVAGFDGIASTGAGTKNFNIYTGYSGNALTSYANEIDGGFERVMTKKIPREAGWHQIVIRITDETLKVYYDGEALFCGFGRQLVDYAALESYITSTSPSYNIADMQQSYTGVTEIDVEEGTSSLKKNVTFNVGENGSVAYWKSSIADGTVLSYSEGSDLKFKVTPVLGYVVGSITVNGEQTKCDEDGMVSVTVSDDTQIKVSFRQNIGSNVTVTYDSEKGTVKCGDSVIESGVSFTASETDGLTLSVEAKTGFKVTSVKINDKDYDGLPSAIEITEFAEQISVVIEFEETLKRDFTELYVSKSGSDINGDGRKESPFATISMARDTIRSLGGNLPEGGITVYVEAGEYPLSDSIVFGEEDSGTKTSPITYKAYNGEVSFVGGTKLATDTFKKVSDPKLLERIIDENAREHIMQIDVASQGCDVLPLSSTGFTNVYKNSINTNFVMNGTVLEEARWPNNDESKLLLECEPYLVGDEDCQTYNGSKLPYRFKYPDKENRTSKWQIKKNDMYLGGAPVVFWAYSMLVMDSVDTENKILITRDHGHNSAEPGAMWGQQYKIFFAHVFEELDRPGEYYYDRDTGILYLYPIGDTENAEIYVSELKEPAFKLNKLSYVTFDGIGIKNSVSKLIEATECHNITVKNAEYSGSSAPQAISFSKSDNIIFSSNNCNNLFGSAVVFEGCGNRVSLEPAGILVENNNFISCSLRPTGGSGGAGKASVDFENTCGATVSHNEFLETPRDAIIAYDSCNILIEYNKFENISYFNSDSGAIYWGRDVTTLGYVIRYNYFKDIGSRFLCDELKAGDTCGIFVDDGSTAPEVYGNVFYNAGTSYGNLRSNTGEYWDIYNNIFVNDNDKSDYLFALITWHSASEFSYGENNSTVPQMWRSIDTFTKHLGIKDEATGKSSAANYYNEERINRLLSDTWKSKYAGTNWERVYNLYNEDNISQALALAKEVDDGKKTRSDLMAFLDTKLPDEYKNIIHGNVSVGLSSVYVPDRCKMWDNTNVETNAGKNWFKEYGENWTLTDAGLVAVRKTSPDFENIPFDEIGLLTGSGYSRPVVTIKPEIINGIAASGNAVSAAYTFEDADGDFEGKTKIYWYVADKPNGEFELIRGVQGAEFIIPHEYAGKFLKYEIIPFDATSRRGETVMSEVISVKAAGSVDFSALAKVIAEAIELADNAVAGTETGTYPADSIETLRAAIVAAQAVANADKVLQYEVNDAVKALENGISRFKNSENLTLTFTGIKDILADKNNWVNEKGEKINTDDSIYFDNNRLILTGGEVIRYTGKKYCNEILNFKVRFEPMVQAETLPEINSNDAESQYSIDGASVKVRGQLTAGEIWDAKTDFGLLLWNKNKTFELQEYKPSNDNGIASFGNDVFTEFNKDYVVSFGAYDIGETTKVVLYVDGKLVGEKVCISDANLGLEGYISFRGPHAATKMIISAAEADTTALREKIAEVEDVLEKAEVGSDYGQYTAEAIAELKAVVADAEKLSADDAQLVVDRMVLALDVSAKEFGSKANDTSKNASGEYTINNNLEKAEFDVADNNAVVLKLDKNELTPEIFTTTATEKGTIKMEIPRGTKLSAENWSGELKSPAKTETPSASIGTGVVVSGVYNVSETVVEADRLVRFVFPGEGSKRVYYKAANGKYVEIKTKAAADTEAAAEAAIKTAPGAAKIKVGSDLVVYTNFLTEFVTFAAGAAQEDDSDDDYEGGSQGGSYAPSAGGSSGSNGFFTSNTSTVGYDASNSFVFDDMKNHWARTDVMNMYNAGIVTGVTATAFEPDRNITRAEFATLIVKALKLTPEKTEDFADVKDEWFASYVGAAAKAGIIAGADGKFRPGDTITRQEMAVIVVKVYEYLGNTAEASELGFTDKADVANWAKEYAEKAVGAGLIFGMDGNRFAPADNATRAQSVSVISRVLK